MDTETLHDLTAAYSLDALDEHEAREYEQHLRDCPRCRGELAALSEASAALAYGVPAAAPPPALRERILAEARAERGDNVVALRPRWTIPLAAGAAVAVAAALALAVWAVSLQSSRADLEAALRIVGDPRAQRVDTRLASVYVTAGGKAVLVERLPRAEAGKTYEAWVIRDGSARPAATFDGDGGVVVLSRRVAKGDTVAVTLEPRGGSRQPTTEPLLRAPT